MKKELRPLACAVFLVSLVLTAVAALAFVNNVVALVRWWQAFLASGGDSQSVAAHMPGLFPWLDWSAVDYSAVTTFIPLLGFLCLTVSALRLLRGRRMCLEDFPFFRGSDQLNVALGLFGTLWGIIVIGYFKLDTVSMADLMQCLHTALFSTLMAVVWVFMIDRPLVRPFFAWLLEKSDLADTGGGDLVETVDRLVVRLGAASDAFDRRQQAYEAAFEKRQAKADETFAKRLVELSEAIVCQQTAAVERIADAQTKACETIAERQSAADEAVEKRLSETGAAFAKHLSETEAAFSKRLSDADASFARREAETEAAFARRETAEGEAVARALADLERVRQETTEQCARQLAEYQQAFEQRQKEYVEFFKREIEALEKRAKDAESRLKAVVQALQS